MSQSQAKFSVAYDGNALRTHSMDVRDLAPALLSLGQLFDEANRILNGDKASVKLQVKAHNEGSFEIVFELWQSYGSQITDFLSGDFVSAAINLKELVVGGGVGLFYLIKRLKGGKPDKITDLKNGFVRIEFDKDSLEVSIELLRLYQDLAVRKSAEEVLKPLSKEGIDTFEIREKKKIIETITSDEIHYFAVPEIGDEKIQEYEHESAYSIISLAFREDNKWRLYDGNSTINVSIKDEEFLRKVEQDLISFAKNDILMCRVRTTQWRTDIGLKTEYEVLEVIEHKAGARQLKLFDT